MLQLATANAHLPGERGQQPADEVHKLFNFFYVMGDLYKLVHGTRPANLVDLADIHFLVHVYGQWAAKTLHSGNRQYSGSSIIRIYAAPILLLRFIWRSFPSDDQAQRLALEAAGIIGQLRSQHQADRPSEHRDLLTAIARGTALDGQKASTDLPASAPTHLPADNAAPARAHPHRSSWQPPRRPCGPRRGS